MLFNIILREALNISVIFSEFTRSCEEVRRMSEKEDDFEMTQVVEVGAKMTLWNISSRVHQ